MFIQYAGFTVADSARIYSFRVTHSSQEPRDFTVQIPLRAFRPAALRLQDGPAICSARLKQELAGETEDSPAHSHLSIEEQDVREYLERRRPPPALPG